MESTSDPTDIAIRKLVKAAKNGYITHGQVNAILSSEEFTPDQIEDVFVTLSEMRINVVEERSTRPSV
jgi:RNA polymerase primary sigma factor